MATERHDLVVKPGPQQPLFRFRARDPDRFLERISAVAATSVAEPTSSGRFLAEIVAARLPRLATFRIRIDAGRVYEISPGFGLTVPLDGPLTIRDEISTETYRPGSAHLALPGSPFEARMHGATSVLVVTTGSDVLRSRSLTQARRIDLGTPHGATLSRYLEFVWTELRHGGRFLHSPTATGDIENLLLSLLLLAAGPGQPSRAESGNGAPAFLRRAEEYLRENLGEPVSVADLSEATSRSVSTLIRAFQVHHGISPMRFRKQLRLEAAQRDLLAADPAETTVTEVAMRYGFYSLGRFSGDYQRAFGELPSDTLKI